MGVRRGPRDQCGETKSQEPRDEITVVARSKSSRLERRGMRDETRGGRCENRNEEHWAAGEMRCATDERR